MHQVGNQPRLRLISRVAVSAFQENDLPSSPPSECSCTSQQFKTEEQ